MNHRLCFTGFSKAILLGLAITSAACTDVSSGVTSSSSSKACPGDGGLVPEPVAPQFTPALLQPKQKHSKFSLSRQVLKLKGDATSFSKGTKVVAIIDELCALNSSTDNDSNHLQLISHQISHQLTDKIRKHGPKNLKPLRERAHSWTLPKNFEFQELKSLSETDPCLLALSEEVTFQSHATTVNDPQYASQIHLAAIQAPTAWDTFYSNLTSEVIVAIIDDGIQLNHPDLSPNLWVNTDETPANGIDDGNGYVDDVYGYNFMANIGSPAHEAGTDHGTHVSGLTAARDNNSIGVTGVMGRNIKIMSLNSAGNQPGSTVTTIVNAINYAVANGADVINMSLGAQATSDPIRVAMANAVAAGVFITASAGNEEILVTDANFYIPMGYARDLNGAMSIGSLDATTLDRSDFSNYSTSFVEIAAPGSNTATGGVLSTLPSNGYGYKQGTSMSGPVVAGAAALLIGWAKSRGIAITPATVESLLSSSADSLSNLTPYFKGGASLNLANLAVATGCL